MTNDEYTKWQDEIIYQFIQRVQAEVTQSCALPLAVPIERIPEFVRQAAQWFYLNDDWSHENVFIALQNSDIIKKGTSKSIKLPTCVTGIMGCYKIQQNLKYSTMGDFSIERMMMSSYSMFGGVGTVGGGMGNYIGMTGYTLTDVVTSLYEVSTFDQYLNPPLTFDYNIYSHRLTLLGELGGSDLLIDCFRGIPIQDLINNYYFFRLVVCMVKQSLSTILGTYEFKLPGGVTINYSKFSDEANDEREKIEEWVNNHNAPGSIIMQPNTL